LTQFQLRLPQKILEEIDWWVDEGRFKSRNDATRLKQKKTVIRAVFWC
jgi:Arc/MetJ-type ribon-helix-helix transcriptional regulator